MCANTTLCLTHLINYYLFFSIYISRVVNNLPKFLSSNRLFVRPFKIFGEEHHSQITNQQWQCKLNSPNYTRPLEYSCLNFYLYMLFLFIKLTIFNWLVLICKKKHLLSAKVLYLGNFKMPCPTILKKPNSKVIDIELV